MSRVSIHSPLLCSRFRRHVLGTARRRLVETLEIASQGLDRPVQLLDRMERREKEAQSPFALFHGRMDDRFDIDLVPCQGFGRARGRDGRANWHNHDGAAPHRVRSERNRMLATRIVEILAPGLQFQCAGGRLGHEVHGLQSRGTTRGRQAHGKDKAAGRVFEIRDQGARAKDEAAHGAQGFAHRAHADINVDGIHV
ncbi:hypothetical protein PsorP6_011088 [Peronosclerospora sorghi]|uniref:Uncharacterized protein n=1 Tax=Peronosclerospora sorghi TaxID=230839 RepID=A0ACC0VX81_9STRA|nr:hypothetical protein PsorP6_011088 [Peronosclerospora sorghi]